MRMALARQADEKTDFRILPAAAALPVPTVDALSISVRKIIAGGQTGVDRGALVAAIELGLAHGGYCPRGRLAEDGIIDGRFDLTETESAQYHVRTERNVVESDGTLIIHRGPLRGGTALTREFASRHQRPCLLVDLNQPVHPEGIRNWLREHRIATLNVAGPRESSQPGIEEDSRQLVRLLLVAN